MIKLTKIELFEIVLILISMILIWNGVEIIDESYQICTITKNGSTCVGKLIHPLNIPILIIGIVMLIIALNNIFVFMIIKNGKEK